MRGEKAKREAGRTEGYGEKAALESRPLYVVLIGDTKVSNVAPAIGMEQGVLDMNKEM